MTTPSEKDILYQMLSREIDNILLNFGPLVTTFSGTIKSYLFNTIDPYVDAFLSPETNKINTKAASSFVKEEVNNKVNDFLKKFEAESGHKGPNDYVV
jgi:hypothetical protein